MDSERIPRALSASNPNKYMKLLITTLGVLAIAGSLVIAEDKPPGPPPGPGGPGGPGGKGGRPNPEEAFKKMDANSDSSVSLEEFKASPRGQRDAAKAEEAFKKMDKDSDGKVTLEEFKTGRPQRGPGGPGGGKGGPGGEGGKPPGKPPGQ